MASVPIVSSRFLLFFLMKGFARSVAYLLLFCSAIAAVYIFHFKEGSALTALLAASAINLTILLVLILESQLRGRPRGDLVGLARQLGLESRFQSDQSLLNALLKEVERKNQAFSVNVISQKIAGKAELSETLERLVQLAYKMFDAESVELALFDRVTNLYHSSIVIGTPLHTSAQAMLSDAAAGAEVESRPDVLIQPLAFAGSLLGTLRISLKQGSVPRVVDQEIAGLLSLQASLAIINSRYTAELVRMKHSSEESLKAKTGFLANLSHEIRAPLGVMLNAVELVLDGLCGEINADQAETLGMVHKNGEHLLELINDVLDYAKVESGRLQINKLDIRADEILEDVCNVVRSQAEMKRHKLCFKRSAEPLAFSCDRRHARQMLINLLSNAIKYTPDGGEIVVWAERYRNNKIRLHVRDSGVGIEHKDRELVFAPFERLDNSYSLNQVGTGIGMSLTRRLVEVNGGKIDFSSEPGKGSDFWLTFPVVEAREVLMEPEEKEPKQARGKGEALLLVELEQGERDMVARYLTHQGFRVFAVKSQQEAMDVFRTKKIDLAIIDNKAADNSNDDVIKGIRQDPNGAGLPIILVSSRGFVFDIERYLKAGIDRCLIKPLKLAELSNICRQLLDGKFEGELIDAADESLFDTRQKAKKETPVVKSAVISLQDLV